MDADCSFHGARSAAAYTIDSEEQYAQLRMQVKTYLVLTLIVTLVPSTVFRRYDVSFVLVAVSLAIYSAWMWVLLPRLQTADERLSLRESMTSQARAHGPVVLWLLTIVSLAFVAGGVLMLVASPDGRMIALGSILFFALCAAMGIGMLVLRREAT